MADLGPLRILSGNITWYRDPKQPGVWYAAYALPHMGSRKLLVFEATPEQMKQIFGTNLPQSAGSLTLQQISASSEMTYAGSIAEMEGEGNFNHEVQRVIALAQDEGYMPDWLKDSAGAWDLLYVAVIEEKGIDWLLEQWSKLPVFKAHYPHLDTFQDLGLTLRESVQAYNEFSTGVKQLMLSIGRDPNSVGPNQIGDLISKGHTLTSIADHVETWRRMQKYAPAMKAFNEILTQRGMEPLNPGQMFAFVRGTAPAQMYQIYEAASFREAASAAGLGEYLTPREAVRLAIITPGITDPGTVTESMQAAAATILRLRTELNLGKFGLEYDDIIDIAVGIRPRSGRTEADIREAMDRAMLGAKDYLSERAQPFRSYTSAGVPQSASLSGMRPTSAD